MISLMPAIVPNLAVNLFSQADSKMDKKLLPDNDLALLLAPTLYRNAGCIPQSVRCTLRLNQHV